MILLDTIVAIHLMTMFDVGTYKQREEAKTQLIESSVPMDYLFHIYRKTDIEKNTERKLYLKEVLRARWNIEKTDKYTLYSSESSTRVSDQMWEDFNEELRGTYTND